MTEAETLRRRRDDLALDYADGAMTREQFRVANERVLGCLGDIEAKIAVEGSASPLAIVAAADVDAGWADLSVAGRRGSSGTVHARPATARLRDAQLNSDRSRICRRSITGGAVNCAFAARSLIAMARQCSALIKEKCPNNSMPGNKEFISNVNRLIPSIVSRM